MNKWIKLDKPINSWWNFLKYFEKHNEGYSLGCIIRVERKNSTEEYLVGDCNEEGVIQNCQCCAYYIVEDKDAEITHYRRIWTKPEE